MTGRSKFLRITRRELYELVWSQPMRTVAAAAGFSDVALAKACRGVDIPVPERGYWAKKAAGKSVMKRPLPPRFPGGADVVQLGRRSWGYYHNSYQELLDEPLPPAPTFDEEMDSVVERVRKMVGKVPCPKVITKPHRLIAALIDHDQLRRASPHPGEKAAFDGPLGKRRLRILNAILSASERVGCVPSMTDPQYETRDRELYVGVGGERVALTLIPITPPKRPRQDALAPERLQLSIRAYRHGTPAHRCWEDTDDIQLEERIAEIVNEIIVAGEVFHRDGEIANYQRRVEQKAEIEEQARRERAQQEREALELREKQARQRIGRLLRQAADVDRATRIRRYADVVLDRVAELPVTRDDLERWAAWARTEADRIDPVKNGTVADAVADLIGSFDRASLEREGPTPPSSSFAASRDPSLPQ